MLKLLITSALIILTTGMAMADMIPEKCQKLHVTDFTLDRAPYSENLIVNAYVHNDDQFALVSATFYFDLLISDNVKVGEAAASIGRLLPGEIYQIKFYTNVKEITFIVTASIYCFFSR